MRVLIWSEAFWPYMGGIELFLARLVRGLREHGHEVSVLTAHGALELPDEDSFEGTPVRRIDLFRAFAERRPDAILRCRRTMSEVMAGFAPDLVHLNPMGPGAIFGAQAIGSGPPMVVSIHAGIDGIGSAANDTAFGAMLARASWITAAARSTLAQLERLAPASAAISSMIPLGIELPPESPPPASFNPPRLFCAGRLVRMKGFDVAIAALARLLPTHPDLTLTIAGDGPERAALEAQAAAAGLTSRVEFLGWTSPDEVAAEMRRTSVVLVPSRAEGTEYTEGLTIVALEASAAARAVVASRTGGLPEAIRHEVSGLLVAPDDDAALAGAVATLLADPQRAGAMGAAGRSLVRREFSWEASFAGFHELFLRLAREAGGRNARTDP